MPSHAFITIATITLALTCMMAIAEEDTLPAAPKKNIETSSNGCQIERYTIRSESMDRNIRIAVVLPPEYDKNPDKQYPIVHTLHGMNAPFDTFAHMSKLHAALADKPMIFTCLDADKASWYIDATKKPESQFETFFFDEFIPHLDANYRTNGKRGITGFSMGGFGSMYYAMRKPEMFTAVCTLSAGLHEFSKADEKYNQLLLPYIGTIEENPEKYASMDTSLLLKKNLADGKQLPKMMIRCGTEDFLLQCNRDFIKMLIETNAEITEKATESLNHITDKKAKSKKLAAAIKEKAIDFSYTEQPGAHNWAYWHDQAPDFVRFFWKHLGK